MAGARGCFNCGGCASCFRVVVVSYFVCRHMYLYLPSPPPLFFFSLSLVVRVAVLTGTASFFFFYTLHIYRSGTIKIIIQTIDRCVYMVFLSRRVIQSDTRLQTAQRLALLHGKEPVLHPINVSLDRVKKAD
jgi:hypothetical protein